MKKMRQDVQSVIAVQSILDTALLWNVSDVHLYLENEVLKVSFRMRGTIHPFQSWLQEGSLMVRRIKALAKMDLTDLRIPQDGVFEWDDGIRKCSVRVSSIPTVSGESIVLRLFQSSYHPSSFENLGMSPKISESLKKILNKEDGLILIVGPTNSGKTTSLYTMTHYLSQLGRSVVSLEHPVEYRMNDLKQIEVRERSGMTFEMGITSLLRQDPDVLMIGEIRDPLTANMAIRAALSGRMVLSTTHARDEIGAIARLHELGISKSFISELLIAILIQKLVSIECRECKGSGCTICQYSGIERERKAIFQLSEINAMQRSLILDNEMWTELRRQWNNP
ncbi:type II secretory ATPase GspE/PulE/Tfp pilus assembly ATPase PilB-like protein [Alicyclobacillus tengchongensis]|uniref:Type II secretory ATPase GspE/PulE/Tfp pilus assembly ATPase PilB-like protein n=1 Tax=Alicyclobacillus tolerans TaxID=90970 RepID=A0ABT9LWX1_9BACL|nr:type II secretory ATPase GspE/PulE/Tfp pilus assembly ATPase PilB-like protein [Alicyclobacillus tengchongensis]